MTIRTSTEVSARRLAAGAVARWVGHSPLRDLQIDGHVVPPAGECDFDRFLDVLAYLAERADYRPERLPALPGAEGELGDAWRRMSTIARLRLRRRLTSDVDTGPAHYFKLACDSLRLHAGAISALAGRLIAAGGVLSATAVASILAGYADEVARGVDERVAAGVIGPPLADAIRGSVSGVPSGRLPGILRTEEPRG